MSGHLSIQACLEEIGKTGTDNAVTFHSLEFAEAFELSNELLSSFCQIEDRSAIELKFNNMSGKVTVKDIDCISNLSFTAEENFMKGKKLEIRLENVKLDKISFEGLKHETGKVAVSFKNVIANEVLITDSILNNPTPFSISDSLVEELSISGTTFVYEEKKDPAIIFTNSIFAKVDLDDVATASYGTCKGEGEIRFENCFLKRRLSISSSDSLGHILLSRTALDLDKWWETQGNVAVDSLSANIGTVQQLAMSNASIKDLIISNCNVKELVAKKTAMEALVIMDGCTLGRLSFEGCKPPKEMLANIGVLDINNASIEVLNVNGNNHQAIGKLRFTNASIRKGLIKEAITTSIYMEDSMMGDSFLQIIDCYTNKISFINFNNLGVIYLINLGKKFAQHQGDSAIELKNSTMGKVHFYDCKFSNYLEYKSSSVSDITVLNTELPWRFKEFRKDEGLLHSLRLKIKFLLGVWRFRGGTKKYLRRLKNQNKSAYNQQKSLLGQLRRVYEQNNDVSNAILYNARQLDIVRKQNHYGWERFALWLNWGTNFYGSDLRRAFWITFAGCVLFYLLYGAARGYIVLGPFNWEYFNYMATNFLEFLSPVRRINLLMPAGEYASKNWNPAVEKIDGATLVVSGISRIIVSYLLVQFILAFRKYGRKA